MIGTGVGNLLIGNLGSGNFIDGIGNLYGSREKKQHIELELVVMVSGERR